jgi:hypothetical protein
MSWISTTTVRVIGVIVLVLPAAELRGDTPGNAGGPLGASGTMVTVTSVVPTSRTEPALFSLIASRSSITISHFARSESSHLAGEIAMIIGDPRVAVPAIEGNIGVSVAGAFLLTDAFRPVDNRSAQDRAWKLTLDKRTPSTGVYNSIDHSLSISLYLVCLDTQLGPMPIELQGSLVDGCLSLKGDNRVPDAAVALLLAAYEQKDADADTADRSSPIAYADLVGPRYRVSRADSRATFTTIDRVLYTDLRGTIRFTAVDFDLGLPDDAFGGSGTRDALQTVRICEASLEAVQLLDPTDPILERISMRLDRTLTSIGSFNAADGSIEFTLFLTDENGASLPVPMPVRVSGELQPGELQIFGDTGEENDFARLQFEIHAHAELHGEPQGGQQAGTFVGSTQRRAARGSGDDADR